MWEEKTKKRVNGKGEERESGKLRGKNERGV